VLRGNDVLAGNDVLGGNDNAGLPHVGSLPFLVDSRSIKILGRFPVDQDSWSIPGRLRFLVE